MSGGSSLQVNDVDTEPREEVWRQERARHRRGLPRLGGWGPYAVLLPWMPTAAVDPFPPHLFTPFGLDVVDL